MVPDNAYVPYLTSSVQLYLQSNLYFIGYGGVF